MVLWRLFHAEEHDGDIVGERDVAAEGVEGCDDAGAHVFEGAACFGSFGEGFFELFVAKKLAGTVGGFIEPVGVEEYDIACGEGECVYGRRGGEAGEHAESHAAGCPGFYGVGCGSIYEGELVSGDCVGEVFGVGVPEAGEQGDEHVGLRLAMNDGVGVGEDVGEIVSADGGGGDGGIGKCRYHTCGGTVSGGISEVEEGLVVVDGEYIVHIASNFGCGFEAHGGLKSWDFYFLREEACLDFAGDFELFGGAFVGYFGFECGGEVVRHAVEGVGEEFCFVVTLHLDAGGKLATGDALGAFTQLCEWTGKAAGEPPGYECGGSESCDEESEECEDALAEEVAYGAIIYSIDNAMHIVREGDGDVGEFGVGG